MEHSFPAPNQLSWGVNWSAQRQDWAGESDLLGQRHLLGHLLAVGPTSAVRVGNIRAVADPVRRDDRQALSHLPEPRRVLGPHLGEVLPGLVRRLALVSGRLQAVKGLVELFAVDERIG